MMSPLGTGTIRVIRFGPSARLVLARICHTEERAGRLGNNGRRLRAVRGKWTLGSVLQA